MSHRIHLYTECMEVYLFCETLFIEYRHENYFYFFQDVQDKESIFPKPDGQSFNDVDDYDLDQLVS